MGSHSIPVEEIGRSGKMKLNLGFIFGSCLVVLSNFGAAHASLSSREIIDQAVGRLTNCERAIWSCCQTDRPNVRFPTRCFEGNGCPELWIMGARVCSNDFLAAISGKIQHTAMEIRDLDRNDVYGSRSGFAPEPIKYVAAQPRFFYRNM